MHHLPRPHSRYFRAVLVLAALAWVMLASGALAAPLQMAMPGQTVAFHASAPDCDSLAMAHAAVRQSPAPAMPMGHGDCCHGGCHCLSACNAALAVPRLVVVETFARVSLPTTTADHVVRAPVAQPLRPPIT